MEAPKRYCLVSGVGKDICKISSFDSALLDAGIGNYNLVKISSILPPESQSADSISAADGSVLYTAYIAETTTDSEQISAAVAVAIPENRRSFGVIIKYALKGPKSEAEKEASWLAERAMKKRGIPVARIESIGAEIIGGDTCYSTAFAGLVLLD